MIQYEFQCNSRAGRWEEEVAFLREASAA
eukprot:COSAG02_NODE_34712_length_479_cov_1.871053_1_plen_28_part_10